MSLLDFFKKPDRVTEDDDGQQEYMDWFSQLSPEMQAYEAQHQVDDLNEALERINAVRPRSDRRQHGG